MSQSSIAAEALVVPRLCAVYACTGQRLPARVRFRANGDRPLQWSWPWAVNSRSAITSAGTQRLATSPAGSPRSTRATRHTRANAPLQPDDPQYEIRSDKTDDLVLHSGAEEDSLNSTQRQNQVISHWRISELVAGASMRERRIAAMFGNNGGS